MSKDQPYEPQPGDRVSMTVQGDVSGRATGFFPPAHEQHYWVCLDVEDGAQACVKAPDLQLVRAAASSDHVGTLRSKSTEDGREQQVMKIADNTWVLFGRSRRADDAVDAVPIFRDDYVTEEFPVPPPVL